MTCALGISKNVAGYSTQVPYQEQVKSVAFESEIVASGRRKNEPLGVAGVDEDQTTVPDIVTEVNVPLVR
jgi:hypothetical protein